MPEDLVSLPFTVVEFSSEENGCEAAALHTYREDGEGWQSERGRQYLPQTLLLHIQHEDSNDRMVHAVEILCHESKIAEKIEISLGSNNGDALSSLGYITLDSNIRSGFQARELKSIPVEKRAEYVQLVLQGCHKNPHNVHNQVGLIGIRIFGVTCRKSSQGHTSEEDVALVSREQSTPCELNLETLHSASKSVMPVKKIEIPSGRPVSSLPSHVKHELDPKLQCSVDRLERLKKERASIEDFDMAAKIKGALGSVYALLIAFKDCESKMREAAKKEDYELASQLKSRRDESRQAATNALSKVEAQFIERIDEMTRDAVGDLSISTINDESFVSHRSQISKQLSPKKSFHETRSSASRAENSADSEEESNEGGSIDSEDEVHPLDGVDNAEELPAPEEIKESKIASPDLTHKVEALFGTYRMKCFFSKNWALREAALAKMTLLIPEVCSNSSGDCAEAMCNIIEVAIDDKNLQVYLTALILLDESILQLESCGLPQNKTSSLMQRIIINLLNKLADGKQKVVDSAELALLSMASSSSIDYSALVSAATKRVRSKDSKGGRSVKARLHFLEHLAAEYGDKIAWKRVIEFAKGQKAFEHKDGGVRDAAKSVVVTLMTIHGEETILESLQDCDRAIAMVSAAFPTKANS